MSSDHLVTDGLLSKYVSSQRLARRTVSRILFHAVPETDLQFIVEFNPISPGGGGKSDSFCLFLNLCSVR